MSQSAISNRLSNSFNRTEKHEIDLQKKLSIQAKQNALPKGTFYLHFTLLILVGQNVSKC